MKKFEIPIEIIEKESLKCKSRMDFKQKKPRMYEYLQRRKLIDKVLKSLPSKRKPYNQIQDDY